LGIINDEEWENHCAIAWAGLLDLFWTADVKTIFGE
jgi:hypothetical protein